MPEPAHIAIGNRKLGPGFPPFIVAEISANHGGALEHARSAIRAAKAAGADAVKLQTYTADTLTIDHKGPGFRIDGGLWDGRYLYDLYQEAHTPWEWHLSLFSLARELGLEVFSTPFDESAVDFLETLNPPAYKIASFELIDLPLIRKIAKTGRQIIMSTGMGSMGDIEAAVRVVFETSGRKPVLLHCISAYPAPIQEFNLSAIETLRRAFGVQVGLSDHSQGTTAAVVACALGAVMVEKHFTPSRALGGPDAAFSAEPEEFARLAQGCREAWCALGDGGCLGRPSAEDKNLIFRRSLYVVKDMAAGETFTPENLRSIRPGFGLSPNHYELILGQAAATPISRGTPMSLNLVSFSRS